MDAVVDSCCFCSAIELSANALMLRCLDFAGSVAAVLGSGCACIGLGIVVAGAAAVTVLITVAAAGVALLPLLLLPHMLLITVLVCWSLCNSYRCCRCC